MWKQFLDAIGQIVMLTQETRQNKTANAETRQQLKEVQEEVKELSRAVQRLAYEIHRIGEVDKHERDIMALRLENELLRFERRLISGEKKPEQEADR